MFSSDSSCELHTTLFKFSGSVPLHTVHSRLFPLLDKHGNYDLHTMLRTKLHMLIRKLLSSFHLSVAPQPLIFISVVCRSPAVHILMLAAVLLAAFGHSWHKTYAYTFGMLATVSALCNHHSLRSLYWLPQPLALAGTSASSCAFFRLAVQLRDSRFSSRLSFF